MVLPGGTNDVCFSLYYISGNLLPVVVGRKA